MRTSSRLALARVAAAALLFALVLGTAVPVFAAPTNSAIEAKRQQANDAQAKLDGLHRLMALAGRHRPREASHDGDLHTLSVHGWGSSGRSTQPPVN